MDPYLERPGEWESFHAQFVPQIARTLARVLPLGYRPKSEAMLFIHEPSARRRQFATADDAVAVHATGGGTPSGGSAAVATPSTRMRLGETINIERHRYIEIRTTEEDRVVTVIELLSPSNKSAAADRRVYLDKRRELYRAGVHILQIDLLRAGRRLLPERPPAHDYNAMLMRADRWPDVDVWFWSVRDRLPTLPVPLLEGDGDVPLDLQATMRDVYEGAAYGAFLYNRPPLPPLKKSDAAWADGLVREATSA